MQDAIVLKRHMVLFSSKKASEFYYENRYETDEECYKHCSSMTIESNIKTNTLTTGDRFMLLFLPQEIEVTQEIKAKTFLSLCE